MQAKPISKSLGLLLATLLVALGLGVAPRQTTQPLRDWWREVLLPGQQAIAFVGDRSREAWASFRSADSARAAAAEQENSDLRALVQQLETQLLLARRDTAKEITPAAYKSAELPPLLQSQLIPARVLGRQAMAVLRSHDLLDVGRATGIAADALVFDASFSPQTATLLDQGRDAEVRPGRTVVAGSRIWGKVAEVGPHTSTMLRVTQSGYRDLVQLATPRDGRLHFTARGVLVGRGRPQCEIQFVDAATPVHPGDLVFACDDGVLDGPLMYGKITRLERKPGAPHWDMWMEPAVSDKHPPARVSVLRVDLNPARLATDGARNERQQ